MESVCDHLSTAMNSYAVPEAGVSQLQSGASLSFTHLETNKGNSFTSLTNSNLPQATWGANEGASRVKMHLYSEISVFTQV